MYVGGPGLGFWGGGVWDPQGEAPHEGRVRTRCQAAGGPPGLPAQHTHVHARRGILWPLHCRVVRRYFFILYYAHDFSLRGTTPSYYSN